MLLAGAVTAQQDTAYFWAGGYFDEEYNWHDTVYVAGGQWVDIPVYFYGGPDVWIELFHYPLGANYSLIDSFDINGCSWDFWPFNYGQFGWGVKNFEGYNRDEGGNHPNPPGYHSLSFWGMPYFIDTEWLHAETIIQILSFRVHAASADSLAGLTFANALQLGYDPIAGPADVNDTLGGYGYPVGGYFAAVHFADGYICGRVTDAYGSAIENANVQILNSTFRDSSDAEGDFCLSYIPGGNYRVSVSHPDYCGKVIVGLNVTEGDTLFLDVTLSSGIISGTITDGGMNPVNGVLAEIIGTDFIDTTDVSGYYNFHGLCPGTYDLQLTNPGYCTMLFSDIEIGADDTLVFDAVLDYNSAIIGTIYDADHVPLPGAIIETVDLFFADTTGVDGLYELNSLCAGTFDLRVTLPGYCDTAIYSISVEENSTRTLNIEFDNGGVLTGNITDPDGLPLSGVTVSVEGTIASGTTGPGGDYTIIGICPGEYDITFAKEGYWRIIEEGIPFSHNYPTVLNATMCTSLPDIPDTVEIWAGGNFDSCAWYDTVAAQPGQWLDIPIYFRGGSNVWTPAMCLPLGARQDIIDQFDTAGCSSDYWPFNQVAGVWFRRFGFYNDETHPTNPDPVGYHSISFSGYILNTPHICLHSEIPIKILSFRAHVSDSIDVEDQVIDSVFVSGVDPIQGGPYMGIDSLSLFGNAILIAHYPLVKITSARSAYLLGDVNMYNASWPPAVIGSDVTYLVNFFRGISTSHPCLLDGFWCSADVNGDCRVVGSDVTRLVSYFRGQTELQACPDHPPLWESSQDLPSEAPPGWPNCE